MSKQLLLLVAFCSALSATSLNAQQAQPAANTRGRIVGTVMGDSGPLPSAEVSVRGVKDSTAVATAATSKDGQFMIDNLAFGTYRLRVEYLGFKAFEVAKVAVTENAPVAEVGTIKMQRTLIAHERERTR